MNSPIQWSLEPAERALEASELLARVPRLLRFRLAGREDRLLLRLAMRLGFEGGASLELSADEPSGVRVRAMRGVDEERWQRQLEVELVTLRDLARRPVARRLSAVLEPAAARLHQGLRQRRLSVLPLGAREGGWRMLLLAGGAEHAEDILSSLRDVSRTVLDEARRQRELAQLQSSPDPEATSHDTHRNRARARRALDRQDGMLVTLAHDLKSPLAATRTALQVLSSGRAGEITDQQGEMVELAVRSTQRLEGMIDRMLDAAHKEEKELILDRRLLQANALLERVMAAPAATAREQGKQFAWIGDSDLEIYGDADGIHRILDNLLGNALKFCPRGGNILVSARKRCILPENESLGRVAGLLGRCVDGVEIVVEDDGPGLSEEARERAFERFWQEPSEREQHRGAGLGLSIVHSMVSAHQGWVRLEGRAGRGTRVRVWLPSNEDDAALLAALRSMEDELERRRAKDQPVHLCWIESSERRGGSAPELGRILEDLRLQNVGEYKLAQPHASSALVMGPENDGAFEGLFDRSQNESEIVRRGEASFPRDGENLEELLEHALGRRQSRVAAAVASGAPTLEVAR